MSNEGKGLREEMGEGYLSLLDSVRHSFEQAAWGQEASGNLADDFYRWATPGEDAPKAMDAAELGGGVQVEAAGAQPAELSADRDWNDLEAWVDGRTERAEPERHIEAERGREGPELGE